MSRERLTAVGESVALILPKEALERLGIASGDEVEVSLHDRTLLLQPLDEAERSQQLAILTKSVFTRRQNAYARLAQGPE
jgi:antitoxin component of MazEF toxin-antitoxin module